MKETTSTTERSAGSRSPLQQYLSEIGSVQLLTPTEEAALSKRIQEGDESAREHLIRANLKLVVKIAREYENCGVPLLDLINEGNMGLMKAADRFDPEKGAKFSSYSSYWIKQGMRKALADQSRTVRVPIQMVDRMYHLRRANEKLEEELGREPTDNELADEMQLSLLQV
ncbi:MAG: sigma-70 family RNA polymerase sigma factor, partial [Limisphaerales bacterium]